MLQTSTMGTINMLGLAKRVKARILLASTSEIYGDPTVHPQPEAYWGNVNTIGPRVSFATEYSLFHSFSTSNFFRNQLLHSFSFPPT